MTSPDDTVAENGDDYSDLLVQYHRSLLSGDAGQIDATPSDDFSGAANALRMIERNRQLTSPGDSTIQSGRPVTRGEAAGIGQQANRIGRFEIVRKLGSGGSGAVLLAKDPKLQREVALKVPLPDALLRDEFVERFQREARLAARLRHPHIVSVLETGAVGPIHFIATDFCNGPNLDQWLTEHDRPVQPAVAAKLSRSLADATQHAHSRGILHRDIKPSNILCSRVDGDGSEFAEEELPECVRLSDFGLAKSVTDESQVTSPAAILGTPAYMAPEQAAGEIAAIGTHSDVFSLGIVLYQMLTNVSPFERETPLATLEAVREFEPKPPRSVVRSIPADLEAICMKCLHKHADDRYQTAAALAEDLERFLANRPVRARRISTISLLRRWANRNPAIAALLCVLCFGTIAAGGVIVQSHRETLDALEGAVDARKSAETNATLARKAVYGLGLSEFFRRDNRVIAALAPCLLLILMILPIQPRNLAGRARQKASRARRKGCAMLRLLAPWGAYLWPRAALQSRSPLRAFYARRPSPG